MHVSMVRINGFKVFRDFCLPLQEGLNVIAGDNDVGKSQTKKNIANGVTGTDDQVEENMVNLAMDLFRDKL